MRNLKKSFLSLVLCFVVALFSGTTIFAQEIYNYDELDIVDAGETSEGVVANFSAEPVVDEEAEEEDSRSVSYVTNTLSGELIPGNDGVTVIFNNAGIDKIPSLTVVKRKNRCIHCVCWIIAIFCVVTVFSIFYFPLLSF